MNPKIKNQCRIRRTKVAKKTPEVKTPKEAPEKKQPQDVR